MFARFLLALAAHAIMLPGAASAKDGDDLYEAAVALRPGGACWADAATHDATGARHAGPLSIIVSVVLQRAYVYSGDRLIGIAAVSTGRAGRSTPTGVYPILQKARWHRSNIYSNAPMPFMQRLTWDGIALHAGRNPGSPASHGCVRLPTAFARSLFAMTTIRDPVTVTDYPTVVIPYDPDALGAITIESPRLDYATFD